MLVLLHVEAEGHQTHIYEWPLTPLEKLWVLKVIQGQMSISNFLGDKTIKMYLLLHVKVEGHETHRYGWPLTPSTKAKGLKK